MALIGAIAITAGLLMIYMGFSGHTLGEIMRTVFGPAHG